LQIWLDCGIGREERPQSSYDFEGRIVVDSAVVVLDVGEDVFEVLIDKLGSLKSGKAFSRIRIRSINGCKNVNIGLFDSQGAHAFHCLLQFLSIFPLLAWQKVAILQSRVLLVEDVLINDAFANHRSLQISQLPPLL